MTLLGSKRSRTTAYHPQANGMVERFHRQLKAALKAQPNPDAWMDSLPLILLNIRTVLKEDISTTSAEMVYGTTLRLPGEFFASSPYSTLSDPSDFVSKLKSHFHSVRPIPPRTTQRNSNLPHVLSTTTHVFVRHGGVRKPLQSPYDGPFEVLSRTDKHFTVKLNGRTDTISIDRLKPAHIDTEQSPNTSTTTTSHPTTPTSISNPTSSSRTTRSGRHVHFPNYLTRYVS